LLFGVSFFLTREYLFVHDGVHNEEHQHSTVAKNYWQHEQNAHGDDAHGIVKQPNIPKHNRECHRHSDNQGVAPIHGPIEKTCFGLKGQMARRAMIMRFGKFCGIQYGILEYWAFAASGATASSESQGSRFLDFFFSHVVLAFS
jgi:hypothetical protein